MRSMLIATVLIIVACKETSAPIAGPARTIADSAEVPSGPPAASAIPAPAPSAGAGASVTPGQAATPSETPTKTWNFDADNVGAPPTGFSFGRTGQGREGRWVVLAATDAPSQPNVLVQSEADSTDYRFPVAVVDGASFKDLTLSVSCKPISGKVDQGCGLVWRVKDANNYYLARANALEDSVRAYHVKDGRRVSFASWSGKVASQQWHKLRVEAKGEALQVYFDDHKVIDATDSTFADAGTVGLWTKADSIIQFDDFSARAP
jgi:hypothetical protein